MTWRSTSQNYKVTSQLGISGGVDDVDVHVMLL